MINLFTSYYRCGDPVRQKEIDFCLQHNVDNPSITNIFVFIDDGSELHISNPKLNIINIAHRPTYADWLKKTQKLGIKGVSILSNSDIHFDENINAIKDSFTEPETFVALSRWDVLGKKNVLHPNPHWSQDVWAVHSAEVGNENLFSTVDFPMGVPRCDNKVAFQFSIYGWKVSNPCSFIKSYHIHETGFRTYDKKLDDRLIGGVAYVHPSETVSSASELDFDVWVKKSSKIRHVKLNKSLEKWIYEAKQSGSNQDVTLNSVTEDVNSLNLRTNTSIIKANKYTPLQFMRHGELVFQHAFRFRVYKLEQKLMFIDNLSPRNPVIEDLDKIDISPTPLTAVNLRHWIPPLFDVFPIHVKQRPRDSDDCQFWQYPCSTEEQAFRNHEKIPHGTNICHASRVVDTYLALPWATYIDKKTMPSRLVEIISPKIVGISKLVETLGYTLRVHTVCQQIHWRRLASIFNELGVTDLHISHMEMGIDINELGVDFNLHSWPLIAVNVEVPERSDGLIIDKPMLEREFLASFIGAHMPHYRSDVRVKLFEAAQKKKSKDVLVDLGNEWHFNNIVYQEQVLGKTIEAHESQKEEDRTVRYNRVISNSIFSLCPEGAGPNTLRVWEAMAVGSIPVVFADEWVPPEVPNSDLTFEDCAIIIKREDVDTSLEFIRKLPIPIREELKNNGLKAYAKYREMSAF